MSSIEWKIPMVIHVDHGGFSLTATVHERLETAGVSWLSRCDRASDDRWYLPFDDEGLRRDPDLVDVVRQLEVELEAATAELEDWSDRQVLERQLLHGLRVVNVRIVVEVLDDDGKETVRVTGGSW